jgi:hypothetical protein
VTSGPIPTGSRTWLDPAWRAGALAWVDAVLAGVGRRIGGTVEQPHVRPWSTALRIPTDEGPVWFKGTGPGVAHEGPLLDLFRELRIARVVLPLAVHPERPWLLFDDAGPTLSRLANELLLACYGPRFTVSLKTLVETAKGEAREGFERLVPLVPPEQRAWVESQIAICQRGGG